jgi:hypothetical protein
LYDYFLASDYLLPLYVTAAIVLYREDEIFKEDCDIASMHCLLSKVCAATFDVFLAKLKRKFHLFRYLKTYRLNI